MRQCSCCPSGSEYTVADVKRFINHKGGRDAYPLGSLDVALVENFEINVLGDGDTMEAATGCMVRRRRCRGRSRCTGSSAAPGPPLPLDPDAAHARFARGPGDENSAEAKVRGRAGERHMVNSAATVALCEVCRFTPKWAASALRGLARRGGASREVTGGRWPLRGTGHGRSWTRRRRRRAGRQVHRDALGRVQ